MPSAETLILSTRQLPPSTIKEAAENGILIDCIPFIHTEAVDSLEVRVEIENIALLSATVIFTSGNAVAAVTDQLEFVPDWKIFCTGHATKRSVEKFFGNDAILGSADDASALATIMTNECEDGEVFFFCGNMHRNELPSMLREANIYVTEIEVYRTSIIAQKITKEYDGILFFSPSAVNGFFKSNNVSKKAVLFAIGKTTANEIKKYSENKIIEAAEPVSENLVRAMIRFFQQARQS
jgi:uroporphyrinogen-III synthase